ncbi:GNAT family N-acetyltransferase [Stackebrandtia nassauensis]|uniref:GNAT family N-acetyltransferase n=1 Tax=Stackebrandtia nassauensis TaxID=283811 RepID=UPI0001A3909F|nr:GNAT family N-acetyltransferase [Stackebrandtia nassauensis]
MKATILPCRDIDVATLEHHNPSPSVHSFHARRFANQTLGDSTYLVAWRERVPVGRAEIKWDGCADDTVKNAHPGVPEINGLEVFPETLRGNGLGTQLVTAAETEATARGLDRIGLGVAQANPAARRLYERLGYHGTHTYLDRYSCLDSLGTWHHFADACVFLSKPLPRQRSRVAATSLVARLRAALTGARPHGPRHM